MSDTTNHDLLFKSENRTNELADGELDDRDLEAINGAGFIESFINSFAPKCKLFGNVSQAPRKIDNALGEGVCQGQRDG